MKACYCMFMHAGYKVANACCRCSETVAEGGPSAVRLLEGGGVDLGLQGMQRG